MMLRGVVVMMPSSGGFLGLMAMWHLLAMFLMAQQHRLHEVVVDMRLPLVVEILSDDELRVFVALDNDNL